MNVTFDRPGWSYEILKALHVFHQQEEYCDVVVVCNDKKIRAHSCVLAAASPWVASELQCGSSEGPVQIVSLEDTPSQVVQYIMTFVYTGQFKVPLKHMKEVQALAGRLRIKCMDDDEEEGGEAEDTPQDYEVPVPDSSLPSDTVVTLNTDWNEADSTPSASQSDSKPSVSHSHRPPAASPARHAGPSHSQGSVPTSPPIYSRPVSLKRSVQDPQSDIPGKRKRGRPKKAAATIATPPVTTETHTVQSAASRISDQAAEQSGGDSDNDSLRDNSLHDNSDVESVGGVVKEEEADDPETEDPTAVKSDDPGTENPTAVKSVSDILPLEGSIIKLEECSSPVKSRTPVKPHVTSINLCPACGKSFTTLGHLKEHMSLHTGTHRHNCGVCGKGFNQKANLRAHVMDHLEIRSFQCKQCEKTYKYQKDLQVHIKSKHEERTFQCVKCQKVFIHSSSLANHMQLCVYGIKFPCPECNYVGNYKSNLKKHMKNIH